MADTTLPVDHATVRGFVDGAWLEDDGAELLPVLNPSTGEVLAHVAVTSEQDVDRAVLAAVNALPAWAASTPRVRSEALLALADLCVNHFDELAMLEALDAGKPIAAVRDGELPGVIDGIRFFAGAARAMSAPAPAEYIGGTTSIMLREPVGVVAAITPWNYPLWQALWKICPAVATGNTMVIKPAELTPMSTTRLVELASHVLPHGVLNIVHGPGRTTGEHLTRHPRVDLVSFTGSVAAGKHVAHAAADGLKRVVMELGGNAPAIVFADADLAAAAEAITTGALYNAGQECTAPARVLVHVDVAAELGRLLADATRTWTIGDTLDETTLLGPLASEAHRLRVESLLTATATAGGTVVGGARPDRPGFYLEPAIVTTPDAASAVVVEELFGPVVTIQTFTDDDEALLMGNDTAFGLAASVWTRDVGRALRMARKLQFGTVWINAHIPLVNEMPHGGYKQSGYGKDMSIYSLEEYTQIKHVMASLD